MLLSAHPLPPSSAGAPAQGSCCSQGESSSAECCENSPGLSTKLYKERTGGQALPARRRNIPLQGPTEVVQLPGCIFPSLLAQALAWGDGSFKKTQGGETGRLSPQ